MLLLDINWYEGWVAHSGFQLAEGSRLEEDMKWSEGRLIKEPSISHFSVCQKAMCDMWHVSVARFLILLVEESAEGKREPGI